MTLFDKAINELFFDGLDKAEFQQVREAVKESNRQSVVTWAASTAILWAVSLLISLGADAYALCRLVYLHAMFACLVVSLCAQFLVKRVPWTLFPVMYSFEASLLGAGVGIAISQPDVRTVTMIAVAVILPTLFIDRTITTVIMHAFTFVAYALLAKNVTVPDVYSWGLTNLAIFSIVGILVGHVINKSRFERYVYADSARKLAEMRMRYAYYDQMTGLKNRRAYAERIERMSENPPEAFCVVMADVNGLKQTNDTYGHEAGDELIIGTSECLSAAFNGSSDIYRIGGDEFCVIIIGREERALRCLEYLEKVAAEWSGRYISGISISYGMASGQSRSDMDFIVREADSRMYEYKRNYYMSQGADRRRNRTETVKSGAPPPRFEKIKLCNRAKFLRRPLGAAKETKGNAPGQALFPRRVTS